MPSSVIRAFHYRARERQLEIVFTTGRVYRYLEVPESEYHAMAAAFSKGEYFNQHIRDRYAFERMGDVRKAS